MQRLSKYLIAIGMIGCCADAVSAATANLSQATLRHLSALRAGEEQKFDGFPVSATSNSTVRLKAVKIYSDDAHIYVMTDNGKEELPRSSRIFLRGSSEDGSATVAMSVNADGTFADGAGNGPEGSFVLHAEPGKSGAIVLSARSIESTLPKDFQFNFRCGDDEIAVMSKARETVAAQLQNATRAPAEVSSPQLVQRYATVAIDTDTLFMSRLFSNNATSATNWIASMFNTMNTMYETNLQVQLLQGTTILRTGNDPYSSFTPNATGAELDFFGNYWATNETAIPRTFATLLSGQIASTTNSCGASGIAWIDAYCNKGQPNGSGTFGSYSVNQVCTSINIDPNGVFNARIVGHELGHNFGAYHTHCTNVSNGSAPVPTNTIDQCANETSCYSGATSCPAAGSGTIMSYCNMTSQSHCAANTQNQFTFHPTQINDVLGPLISNNSGSCLSTVVDEIFWNGLDVLQ